MDLTEWVREARARTVALVSDLTDAQLRTEPMEIVNPFLWEIGHVAWFQETWALRRGLGLAPLRPDADVLFDSLNVGHDTRWDVNLPGRDDVMAYARGVCEAVIEWGPPAYLTQYTVHHEDMHDEAFTYMRQTLGYPAPRFPVERIVDAGPWPGDVEVPGGTYLIGACRDAPFVFDNEKWAHPVRLEPFRISRAPVTQAEYAAFVADGGEPPITWEGGRRKDFDRWVPREPHRPVVHVTWHQAQAYCAWAGRRLPTEAEWEVAAEGAGPGNLDWRAMGCVDVAAFPESDSRFGCRQMLGNVWEWTAGDFGPYPGFEPDMYREYSEPWFGTRKVLRGGCWATRSRLIRTTWRNFFPPHRRDIYAGFRTCALS